MSEMTADEIATLWHRNYEKLKGELLDMTEIASMARDECQGLRADNHRLRVAINEAKIRLSRGQPDRTEETRQALRILSLALDPLSVEEKVVRVPGMFWQDREPAPRVSDGSPQGQDAKQPDPSGRQRDGEAGTPSPLSSLALGGEE